MQCVLCAQNMMLFRCTEHLCAEGSATRKRNPGCGAIVLIVAGCAMAPSLPWARHGRGNRLDRMKEMTRGVCAFRASQALLCVLSALGVSHRLGRRTAEEEVGAARAELPMAARLARDAGSGTKKDRDEDVLNLYSWPPRRCRRADTNRDLNYEGINGKGGKRGMQG
jgi:hypothetical protein